MKLCARFYDPQKGRVFFGDLPMDKINPESLMSHISMVFQDVYLFQDTVRNNIRLVRLVQRMMKLLSQPKKLVAMILSCSCRKAMTR